MKWANKLKLRVAMVRKSALTSWALASISRPQSVRHSRSTMPNIQTHKLRPRRAHELLGDIGG